MSNSSEWVTKTQLVHDLHQLGITPGDVVMMHSSFRSIGRVIGGPTTVLAALSEVLTPDGTLMMYVGWQDAPTEILTWPEDVQQLFYEHCPPYNPDTATAVRDHGILVECFRTWSGVIRSNHPDCSMGALGAKATWITQDHPFNYGYGTGSPLHKLCQAGGYVLLLGAPLDALTLLHYSEHAARLPGKRVKKYKCPVLQDGRRVWVDLEEFDTGENVIDADYDFETIAKDYLAAGKGRHGLIGNASSYLFEADDLAQFGINWLETRFGNLGM